MSAPNAPKQAVDQAYSGVKQLEDGYRAIVMAYPDAYIQRIIHRSESEPTIVVVGSGGGGIEAPYDGRANIISVDIASSALPNRTETRFPVQASGIRLPFPDNAVDGVVCNNVLHHLRTAKNNQPDLQAMVAIMAEAARVSKTGPCIADPYPDPKAQLAVSVLASVPFKGNPLGKHEAVMSYTLGVREGDLKMAIVMTNILLERSGLRDKKLAYFQKPPFFHGARGMYDNHI
ncbi:class I SAM-dependent methyltransferase [Patescibacteria group bacterium]|nr:class I SAM-dependent methyltransferase [Patescibacteria group bacterium]MCL5091547.1 class I SAM-dependent methyltransferase [Patescibacteria group bacterium]